MNTNIDFASFILQLYNLDLLFKDFKNSDLMGELQKQDKQYLEKIINQNDEMLKILKRKEENMKEDISKELAKKTEEKIKEILESDITPNNLESLYQLVDILKDTKEVESMNYGNYGNYGGRGAGYDSYGKGGYGNYGNYGEYGEYSRGSYGRRGVDSKYRGHDYLERAYNDYGRYEESREKYGANEGSIQSLKYMLESLEDFAKYLKENAQTPEEVQMVKQTAQRIAQM